MNVTQISCYKFIATTGNSGQDANAEGVTEFQLFFHFQNKQVEKKVGRNRAA